MDEKTKGLFDKFMSMFAKEKKILDSMPKEIDKFTDEQKEYLLKETHRLLRHRLSGKSFDSFMPIGYTKDDMEDLAQDGGDDISTAEGEREEAPGSDKACGDGPGTSLNSKKDKEKVTEKEDGAADALPEKEEEAHEKIKEGLKEDIEADKTEAEDSDDGMAEDAPAEQANFHGMDTAEPTKIVSNASEASTQPQAPARTKDSSISMTLKDSVNDSFDDPFAITSQIKTGFGSNLKSGGMTQVKKESK
jgi:hypothetical protein